MWSTEAILRASDPSYTGPKQLAAMSYHSGTIHSVRFSPNNTYLASGADDKFVCVYTLDPNPPAHTTFGSKEAPPVENWRIYRRLTGHDNDVQDIGWSHDASILVSVGLDSKIVVWSGHTFEKLKTISLHQSHVKGITFDPANKYFATASDDRTMKIFRFTSPDAKATAYDQSNNFILETTIKAPFVDSPLTTYFRRPSWSPDGVHVAAANAVNGPVSCISVITRGQWSADISLIGHEGPVEVCAFSPRSFHAEPKDPAAPAGSVTQATVIACAGQDKTLSVWVTRTSKPYVITNELCSKAITDLAWTPDGETLFITSLDGTIVACIFEPGELGYPASDADVSESLSKYGGSRRAGIVENADALRLEESSKVDELKGVEGRMGELMGDSSRQSPVVKVNGTSSLSNGIISTPADSTSAVGDGKAITDKTAGPDAVGDEPAGSDAAGLAIAAAPKPDPQAARIDKLKQRVTITKDGRKRVAPLLVSSSAGLTESSLPRPQLLASTTQVARPDAPQVILDLSKPYDGLPKGGLTSLLLGNKRKFADIEGDVEHRVEKRLQAVQKTGATPIVRNTPDGVVPPVLAPKPTPEIAEPLRPAIVNPSLLVSQTRLSVPLVRATITLPLGAEKSAHDSGAPNEAPSASDDSTYEGTIVFEARNATGPARTGRPQDRQPTRITVTRKGQTIWQDFLPRACLLVAGNYNFWTAACEDGSLYIWTPAGRRLLSAIVLESQPVILDIRGWWLLCVTATGQCHVWNIETLSSPHPPVSLAPVLDSAAAPQQSHLTASPSIMFARLNSKGCIVVGTSNGEGYTYSSSMYVWLRLTEPWWAVGSQYWNTMDTSIPTVQTDKAKSGTQDDEPNVSAGIIPLLERNTTTQSLLKGRTFFLQRLVKSLLSAEGYEGFESAVSIAHLENRLAAAMVLNAHDEFRIYLIMYAKRLGAEGAKGKVAELLKSLMGRVYDELDVDSEDEGMTMSGVGADERQRHAAKRSKSSQETRAGWESDSDEIVGWKREDLLKEVLLLLGTLKLYLS